ncbi:MAG TPA: YncE family protein [Phenylobacterium sp.]|jgi:DNA-binding beta-propeller fold protein YncE|uniref:YncE family protein n=1 Tax=Phenylobacterium sp. TaxID=1871053 RepID=UPI002C9D6B6E|nr:YncE family protein [Phenylobacterium sp.]HXA37367.1 YncE family protein [Phenylobacterium sp.]
MIVRAKTPARSLLATVLTGSVLATLSFSALAQEREAPPLRLVQEIPLPGVQGRLDHFTIDPKRKRVIFSGLGNDSVQVVDAFAGRQIRQIDGLSQPQGSLYVPETDTLYVANSADGNLNIYNGTSFALIKRINFGPGSDPDNLRYDAAAKRVYLGYGEGAIAAIDATTNERVGTDFKFKGHPEGFQLEKNGPRIFVNIADEKLIAVIDRKTGKMSEWKLPPGHAANFPMVLDEARRRVIIGTRKPSRVTVYNMDTGAVVASLPSTGDMDDIFYDGDRQRIYVAGGEGFVSVFQQIDADHYKDMGKFASALGARTGVWYVSRDRLYLAAPPAGGLGARILVFEPQTD